MKKEVREAWRRHRQAQHVEAIEERREIAATLTRDDQWAAARVLAMLAAFESPALLERRPKA